MNLVARIKIQINRLRSKIDFWVYFSADFTCFVYLEQEN